MHDYVKNLAKVVRAAREEAHLSQAALAEQIGCDERTILNIENDRGNPKFEVLCQIIAYLHIPADQIFHPDTCLLYTSCRFSSNRIIVAILESVSFTFP